jgi:hypothetical protein
MNRLRPGGQHDPARPITTATSPAQELSFADKWAQRAPRIARSKATGNVHLDQLLPYVECMRGRHIANVHDPMELGTVLTVSNHGDVVVQWKDAYSASKNYLAVYEGRHPRTRKPIERASWLWSHELEDYLVLDATFATEVRRGHITRAAIAKATGMAA